jgi:type I restriction enzyme S subunit
VINSIPENWELSTLGNISEKPQYGWTTKANHENGSVKLLRTTDITSGELNWASVPFCTDEPEDLDKYLIHPGDIVISRAGSVGFSYLLANVEKAVFASYLIRFRIKKGIEKKFVYYFLKSPDYWKAIGASKLGIAVPNVNATKLAQVQIPIAPLPQQKSIVAEIEKQFSRLDEAVANLKRVKANLKRYKAAVLKAAVEGKLTEEWRKQHPDIEPASKLLEVISQTREELIKAKKITRPRAGQSFTDDDLPYQLPDGWVWGRLDTFVLTSVDCPHSTPKYTVRGVLCVRTADFRPGYLDLSKARFVSEEGYEKRVLRIMPQPGDVLYSREGGILGVACMVPNATRLCMAQRMILFRTDSIESSKYLMHVLNSNLVLGRVRALTGGSASPHLNVGEIRNFLLPIPPEEERNIILEQIENRLSVVNGIEKQIDTNLLRAERLRQSILSKAFSGQLIGGYA